jgi:hypothetical protein
MKARIRAWPFSFRMAAVDGFEREHMTSSMTTLRALSPRKGDAAVEGRRRNAMQNEKESQQRREDGGNRENDNDLPLMICSNYYNSEIPISSLSPMTGVQRLIGE